MPIIIPGDPGGSSESLVLDGLSLNDGASFTLESLTMNPPPKKPEWVTGGDSDGAVLGRDPLFDNRTVTAVVRVEPQPTMDLALAKISAISDKLEEAERNLDGIDLTWAAADGTKTVTFKCLSGEITDLPIDITSGWFVKSPQFTVTMTCKPFGYGTEVLSSSTSSTLPVMTIELTGVPGDVPAEARLIVTDAASKSRAHVEWGLESRYYSHASPSNLLIDSDSMSVTGLVGAQTTRTGAYDPNASGNNVISATLPTATVGICSTGNQAHVGTFRVKLRCYCTNTDAFFRLAWKDGDSPYSRNDFAGAIVTGWNELDLGLITIPPASAGTQRWVGIIEGYSTSGTTTGQPDVLELLPAGEGYGKGRAPLDVTTVGTLSALDGFDQISGALTGKTLPIGGTWQGAGDTDDFTISTGNTSAYRNAVSDASTSIATGRLVTATTPTSLTDTVASIAFFPPSGAGSTVRMGVVVRYTNSSNLLVAYVNASATPRSLVSNTLNIVKRVAGTDTTLATRSISMFSGMSLTLFVGATGNGIAMVGETGGATTQTLSFTDTALATGGALASGTAGLYDRNTSATAYDRFFGNFYAFAPNVDQVIWSAQSAEFRSDSAIREDSSGTYYGPINSYRGSRLFIPPAGDQNRATRIAVKARRNDVDTQTDDQIADNLTVQVAYTPRYLVVPR